MRIYTSDLTAEALIGLQLDDFKNNIAQNEGSYGEYSIATYNLNNHPENQYLNLLQDILDNGEMRTDRTGTGTLSVFGRQVRFDISKHIPVLTTKKLAYDKVIEELLWFMRGSTDSKELEAKGVNIWKGNTSREFLDSRGLKHLPEGSIGAGYGHQWRHFNAPHPLSSDLQDMGVDQLKAILNDLKNNPTSRRIFMSAWNPSQLDSMALPPCHVSVQFYVSFDANGNKHLSCHMYQRSVDVFLGFPWNILSYSILTHILATMCNMKPKELIISTGDTHIYKDHIDQVKEQLQRVPYHGHLSRLIHLLK